jgi:cell division protein FtsQ
MGPALADVRVRPPGPAVTRTRASRVRRTTEAHSGWWHRPILLNMVSDVLMLFASIGLGWALVTWFLSRPLFPVREVIVQTPPAQVTESQLEYVARTAIRGNFFTVDLDTVRASFEKLPWVRHAEVRRRWPDAIELRIEEHQAVAYWTVSESGDARLVNRHGEIFIAASNATMPHLDGPQGSSGRLLEHHAEYSRLLQPLGVQLSGLAMSARDAWQLTLDNGMVIMLGREQDKVPLRERLTRFIRLWPQVRQQVKAQVAIVDLRYPNGFALTLPETAGKPTTPSQKGKK